MTTLADLQLSLKQSGRYIGAIDGQWGQLTESAILTALEDGPDTALTPADYRLAAAKLGVKAAAIMAVAEVEASGAGFQDGFPKILPERHRFSKLTGGRFDKSHPKVSYRSWGTLPYPVGQQARLRLLLDMIRLNLDAGFAACSYGKFQILGENHTAAGFDSSWEFAFAHARDEKTQLEAFCSFLKAEGMVAYLRQGLWADFARRYNGPAYKKNRYDVKLAQAWRKHLQATGE